MNTITIELCAEDRARLDKILEALGRLEPKCDKCMSTVLAAMGEAQEAPQPPQEAPKKAEAKKSTPEPEKPQETAQTQPEQAAPTVTLEQIQQKVVQLAAGGKKAEVREIITRYGKKVSDLKEHPDKLPEVWQALIALEG